MNIKHLLFTGVIVAKKFCLRCCVCLLFSRESRELWLPDFHWPGVPDAVAVVPMAGITPLEMESIGTWTSKSVKYKKIQCSFIVETRFTYFVKWPKVNQTCQGVLYHNYLYQIWLTLSQLFKNWKCYLFGTKPVFVKI